MCVYSLDSYVRAKTTQFPNENTISWNATDIAKQTNLNLPIEWNGNECKHRRCNGHISHEIVHTTIETSEWPIRIQHINEIEHTVQWRHWKISDAQIQ